MNEMEITAAQNAGVDLTEPLIENYFGFSETHVFTFPDGVQKIYFTTMNEGGKAEFQKKTSRDITLQRQTGDARIKADPAEERHALLTACVTGWVLYRPKNGSTPPYSLRNMEEVPFSSKKTGRGPGEFEKWLEQADPKLVEKLETEIRKANPWLLAEMTVKDIDEEMERLGEMRAVAVEREAGEGSSGGR